jgi:hypothetical protein
VVIGLTLEKDTGKLKEFAKQNKLSYPILVNSRKAFRDYRLGQLPNVCYIDRQSIISTIYTGFSPDIGEKMKAETKTLLMIIRARE